MALKNAQTVLGLDPTLLFLAQFAAISHFSTPAPVFVLPLRLTDLPSDGPAFDTVLSMGVLYHQRDPAAHLQQVRTQLSPDGKLLLETLIIPGNDYDVLVPEGRYARMRNVWHLPTRKSLVTWLEDAGFENVRVADETYTTSDEQRSTAWMPYESLREALDPDDPRRTIEQLPAPLRIVVSADHGAR